MGFFARLESRKNLDSLRSRRVRWDQIFGEGAYAFEPWGDRLWMVRTSVIDIAFGRDNDGDRSAYIKLASELYDERYAFGCLASLWGEFIGVEWADWPQDNYGRVALSPKQQLDCQMDLIERLVRDVFSDERKTKQAARFTEQKIKEYNSEWD